MPTPCRIAIMGVTGFIGKELPALLAHQGARVTGVSRSGKGTVNGVDLWQTPEKLDLSGHSAIINLAGERIDQRWTQKNRRKFYESRVEFTRQVVKHIRELPEQDRPRLLINGSAVGYYGNRGDEVLPESSAPGSGYLAELCREWEDAACEAEKFGVRVVTLRTGVVLGKGGPAFQKLSAAFKLGLGGKLGNGQQWMPWIHVDDLRSAIIHAAWSGTLAPAAPSLAAPSAPAASVGLPAPVASSALPALAISAQNRASTPATRRHSSVPAASSSPAASHSSAACRAVLASATSAASASPPPAARVISASKPVDTRDRV